MIRNISTGIDVGSGTVRVLVREFIKGEKIPKIIGVGEAETHGVRHGSVINFEEATASIKNAVQMAERTSGLKIKRAFISIGGLTLRGETSTGIVVVSKANGEVTNLDIDKALAEAEANLNLNNKKVVQSFPISFRLDGKEVFGRLEGMRGTKLEAKSLFITYSTQHLEDLLGAIAAAGVEPLDIIASPVASANIVLTDKQKIVGVALANIGVETVSLAVFENGLLSTLQTFSTAAGDITNDIALGLKIPLEKAENLKTGNGGEEVPKKKLEEIIEARLSDIFELIENHLKKIKRSELLPAGIVFVGGGANTLNLEEFSKGALKLPSRIGTTDLFGNAKTKFRDPAWFTVLGLVANEEGEGEYGGGSFPGIFKDLKNSVKSGLKQLLP